MTYRFVPKKWLRILQVSTLLLTALLGIGIVCLPKTAVQLTKFEQTMSADTFGWILAVAGVAGGLAEVWMWLRRSESLTSIVAWAHIICTGILSSYFIATLWGVLTVNWRVFSTPALILMVTLWHLGFVQRRPREPILRTPDTESLAGTSPRLKDQ